MKRSSVIAGWLIVTTQLVMYVYGLLNRQAALLDLTLVLLIFAAIALGNSKAWGWWVLSVWCCLGVASAATAGATYLIFGREWVAKHFTVTAHGPVGVAVSVACAATGLVAFVLLVADPPRRWRRWLAES